MVQPGGSVRDELVVEAAKKAGITMYFTGTRHFFHRPRQVGVRARRSTGVPVGRRYRAGAVVVAPLTARSQFGQSWKSRFLLQRRWAALMFHSGSSA